MFKVYVFESSEIVFLFPCYGIIIFHLLGKVHQLEWYLSCCNFPEIDFVFFIGFSMGLGLSTKLSDGSVAGKFLTKFFIRGFGAVLLLQRSHSTPPLKLNG